MFEIQATCPIFVDKICALLTNNDILKKLRVALKLTNDDIIEMLEQSNFKITRGALGDLFRNTDHPNYIEAGDQIVRKFLDGMIIKYRGELKNDVKKD